jgi:TolB-like protein
MGVHLGDVAVEGERLYGDGVNVAARLERLAEPGGTCISDDVLHQVQRKLELDFDDLGEQSVKNIPDPVHAYRVRERATEARVQRARGTPRAVVLSATAALAIVAVAIYFAMTGRIPAPAGAPLSSIAVLPFDDMSPGGDQEWLANGMAEELIESLSRIEALRVMARTSAFALRGQDIQTVGTTLKVGSVVEGSVRRSGDELRITAQLIRVADGSHLWSARYDKSLTDVFAIQSEIAREIAEAIRTELGVEDKWVQISLRGGRYTTRDVRAYELWRKGTESLSTMTEEALREGIEYSLQALAIDPATRRSSSTQPTDVRTSSWPNSATPKETSKTPSAGWSGRSKRMRTIAVSELGTQMFSLRPTGLKQLYPRREERPTSIPCTPPAIGTWESCTCSPVNTTLRLSPSSVPWSSTHSSLSWRRPCQTPTTTVGMMRRGSKLACEDCPQRSRLPFDEATTPEDTRAWSGPPLG